jgi:hypothetical protein
VTVKNISNLAASVQARLKNYARACERGEAFELRWLPGGPWTSGT